MTFVVNVKCFYEGLYLRYCASVIDIAPLHNSRILEYSITSVRSQNLVTLIFTETTFCLHGNTKVSIMLQYIVSMKDTMFCHEKDAQNVVTAWFTTKIW